jgi:hypothetical protein
VKGQGVAASPQKQKKGAARGQTDPPLVPSDKKDDQKQQDGWRQSHEGRMKKRAKIYSNQPGATEVNQGHEKFLFSIVRGLQEESGDGIIRQNLKVLYQRLKQQSLVTET